jgi:hypothetical protein
MTKTMEALDLFTRALPSPLPGPDLGAGTDLTVAGPGVSEQNRGPRVESGHAADEAIAHRAAFHSSLPEIDRGRTPAAAARPADSGPRALRAAGKAESHQQGRVAPVRNEGLTRRGSPTGWTRWIAVAVVVVTLGFGSRLLVRASQRAGEACWRQGVGKSFLHAHPHSNPACQRPGSRAI